MALDLDDYAALKTMVGKLAEIANALRRIADSMERREQAELERVVEEK
jgi:hypothetical protein